MRLCLLIILDCIFGNIQPSIVQKSDVSLIAFMRDNGDEPDRILKSTSSNDGFSWSAASKTKVPDTGNECSNDKIGER